MSLWYVGVVAGEDTSSAEHGEGQDVAPQSVPAVNALVLDIEPSGLPSLELKTCGLRAGCVSMPLSCFSSSETVLQCH